jgi:hypothetical protein
VKKWTLGIYRKFLKKEVQMASKFMTKYLTYLVLKEMQIKTTLRLHLTSIRMAIIKSNNNEFR